MFAWVGFNQTGVRYTRKARRRGETKFTLRKMLTFATDAATTTIFTDDPLVSGSSVKAVHITQLRTAVNAMRAAAGLAPQSFADPSLAGVAIKATHLTQLRTALDAARTAIGLPAVPYSDSTITVGSTVAKTAHIAELRSGVK